jgi:hypothetical protein
MHVFKVMFLAVGVSGAGRISDMHWSISPVCSFEMGSEGGKGKQRSSIQMARAWTGQSYDPNRRCPTPYALRSSSSG